MVDAGWRSPVKDFLFAPVVVFPVEPPQLEAEVRQRRERDLRYQLAVQRLVVCFDFASTAWMVRLTENQFRAFDLCNLFLEVLGDKLFAVVQIHLARQAAAPQRPLPRVH